MKQTKTGYLGIAFHEWLEYLEYVEAVMIGKKLPKEQKWMAMNDTMFRTDTDEDFRKMMDDAAPVDAWLARCVRSSVKYKVTADTLALMTHQYNDEINYIRETRPIHLPHEWCTLIVEWGDDTFLLCLQETTSRDDKPYEELGLGPNETWICANVCFYRPTGIDVFDSDAFSLGGERISRVRPEQRLSYCPVEIHMNKGELWRDTTVLNAIGNGVTVTEKGEQTMDILKGLIIAWLSSFDLAAVLRHKTAGVKPLPQSFRPKKPRKRRQFPRFEHTIIELEVDAPEAEHTGRSVYQPHKRLHQVRGFWRQYKKTGKRVWVKPHWRGDERLGVVRRDIELTTHNGDNDVRI